MTLRPLPIHLQDLATNQLNEVPDRVSQDIATIKAWLSKNKYINARTDDQWILTFLRGCKFSLERTKEKIDLHYTMKSLIPEFFQNRDPMLPEIQKVLELGVFLPLPTTKDAKSPRVLLFRNGFYDASQMNAVNIFKTALMLFDVMVNEDDQFIVAGVIMVQDMDKMSMSHLSLMTPGIMKKAMTTLQTAYPTRPQGLHFINIPSFFESLYSVVRPFLKEKARSRLVIHKTSNLDEFYKAVPKSILPKEYGGDGAAINEIAASWKRKVESYRDWFIEDAKYKTVESKRPGKPKTADEFLGIEGSFRKLEVD